MTAKEELVAITRARDWAMINAAELQVALARVEQQLGEYKADLKRAWSGEAGVAARATFERIEADFAKVRDAVRGIVDVLGRANVSLDAARRARDELPSPVVPSWISDLADAALNDNEDNFFVDGVAFATKQGVAGVENFFGNREERAAQEALDELKSSLVDPSQSLASLTNVLFEYSRFKLRPEELNEYFELEFANPDAPSPLGRGWSGGGSGANDGGGGGGGGSTQPTPGGGPRTPLPPSNPWPDEPADPRPPWVPGEHDDSISIDDGSAGAYGPGIGAAALGGAGVAGVWAANSARARAAGAGMGGGSPTGSGGLLSAGGSGVGGAGVSGSGSGSGGPMGMMGGQGGRGGADKDKKPTLAGYRAPSLEDDDDGFIPLPDSARAGGRPSVADEPE